MKKPKSKAYWIGNNGRSYSNIESKLKRLVSTGVAKKIDSFHFSTHNPSFNYGLWSSIYTLNNGAYVFLSASQTYGDDFNVSVKIISDNKDEIRKIAESLELKEKNPDEWTELK